MNELLTLTLIELTDAIKARKASPVELMEVVLQAARAFEAERPWHPDWPTTWEMPG